MMLVVFRLAFPVLLIATLAGACSHVQIARSRQGLMLHSMPPNAQVYVNRKYWGSGAELERQARELSAGSHELLIVAPGYYPYYSRFALKKGELLRRKPHLVEKREK